jgi:hypothetical protein
MNAGPNSKRCPKCGRFSIDRDNRRCTNCKGGFIFFPGDDMKLAGESPYFRWVVRGPRGTGFYRKPLVEHLWNQ